MAPHRPSGFKFTRLDTVGAPDAEMDADFLDACFIDTGDIALLEDASDRRVLLLGRTGTGKSALLRRLRLKNPDQSIIIQPETLALTHVANSQMLNFVSGLGINVDPLFKLLWRHVFVVELLRRYFDQHSVPRKDDGFFAWLQGLFGGSTREDQQAKQAIAYLRQWGESFWEQTEYRVKEITHKIESELQQQIQAALGSKLMSFSAGDNTRAFLSEAEIIEVKARAQEVVSQAQVQDLQLVMKIIDQVLSNRQHPYFVVIDQLDENWIEEKLRYQLIKALILTAREFIGVSNAKIIIALRRDLLDRVFRLSRDSGFQEEKFVGNYLPITWTKGDILSVLDARVRRLVARRYTKQPVSYADVLPTDFDGMDIGTAIFSFAHRPRDVIALFNCCILAGADKSHIGSREFSIALGEYSRGRLRALADEWHADYPRLLEYATILNRRPRHFRLDSIPAHDIEDLCLSVAAEYPAREGGIHVLGHSVIDGDLAVDDFRDAMFFAFYRIGMIGLKIAADAKASWADDLGQAVTRGQVTGQCGIAVHPAYWRVLNCLDR